MGMIDIFIVAVLLWAAFCGWRAGFIKELTATLGTLLGLAIAATCYSTLGEYLTVDGTETNQVTSIIAFLLLWIIVPIALGFCANMLTRAIREMQAGLPNSLLGAVVGVVKYAALLSCILGVMQYLNILNSEQAEKSALLNVITAPINGCFDDNAHVAPANDEGSKPDTIWVDMKAKQKVQNQKKK